MDNPVAFDGLPEFSRQRSNLVCLNRLDDIATALQGDRLHLVQIRLAYPAKIHLDAGRIRIGVVVDLFDLRSRNAHGNVQVLCRFSRRFSRLFFGRLRFGLLLCRRFRHRIRRCRFCCRRHVFGRPHEARDFYVAVTAVRKEPLGPEGFLGPFKRPLVYAVCANRIRLAQHSHNNARSHAGLERHVREVHFGRQRRSLELQALFKRRTAFLITGIKLLQDRGQLARHIGFGSRHNQGIQHLGKRRRTRSLQVQLDDALLVVHDDRLVLDNYFFLAVLVGHFHAAFLQRRNHLATDFADEARRTANRGNRSPRLEFHDLAQALFLYIEMHAAVLDDHGYLTAYRIKHFGRQCHVRILRNPKGRTVFNGENDF